MNKRTHFGARTVDAQQKQKLVDAVFHNSAQHYDLMNDIMSLGMHRIWKDEAIKMLQLAPKNIVCDIAAGSGDLTKKVLAKLIDGHVYMTDINISMLDLGYNRILDECHDSMHVTPVIVNGELMPFLEKSFDRIICGFGIRNMTNIEQALHEFYRCLKPGGRAVILEFSQVKKGAINDLYQFYSQNVIPNMGAIFAKDRESYQYLVDSIARHPDQTKFANLMTSAGFKEVGWKDLSLGAVAIHVGVKI